ncbi:PPE family protein [Mycobacterium riyadhense]|uniref:PPE family protein PPE29 n=1 Tax=Mycobacterium riyadhense TaxID=486698 RepID=A0A1X2CE87_9MYCO|nr:PPE family protein [Mycobacterium riyadhense]MCV7144820.1 PPE family protein [Mycobacterium riyadhense]ORW74345.1 hypothetical protein AWC22_23435 [Mycobacterium riyadhense]VTO99277.1 putative PPE family protein PPE29 [Mycobacterium riyadhense]
MDFGALPPEVNSAKMYSGPGIGSLLVAAASWDAIADELYSAASRSNTIISALTGRAWQGQASIAMATAAARYLAWMNATAAQAQHTAVQIRSAAGAFETAFAATVPPPMIAANRALLMLLTATNVLGVNTPAIATVEAHYSEMWAQDAAAMYGYAAASAAATALPAFASPAEVADPAAQLTSAVPQALQLLSPASSAASTMSSSMSAMSSVSSVAKTLSSSTALAAPVAGEVKTLGSAAGLGGPISVVSAEVGKATTLGTLSVPQSWATTGSAARTVAVPLPNTGSVALSSGTGNMLGGLPIAGMAPRGEGAMTTATTRAGVRPTVMPRPEFAG